jgi:ubiquinone/menaquinone biosynthesis C-methylase UbiE
LKEARAFLAPIWNEMINATKPMRILDIGCGDGVHLAVLDKHGLGSHHYCGVDFSLNAVRQAQSRSYSNEANIINFQVGNALSLPFCSNSFDVVFSYGVISYTGSPEIALDEMTRVCRSEGLLGIWIYPEINGLKGALFRLTRRLCCHLGKRGSRVIANLVVPFLSFLPVRSGISPFNAPWSQCMEIVEVNLFPRALDFFSLEEVLGWFRYRQISVEFIDQERPIAVWARMPG